MNDNERRTMARKPFKGEGFFIRDSALLEVKILDCNNEGVGAYINAELNPGDTGVLYTNLPQDPKGEAYKGEVRWCSRQKSPDDSDLGYRVGLKLI